MLEEASLGEAQEYLSSLDTVAHLCVAMSRLTITSNPRASHLVRAEAGSGAKLTVESSSTSGLPARPTPSSSSIDPASKVLPGRGSLEVNLKGALRTRCGSSLLPSHDEIGAAVMAFAPTTCQD
jgi:hypothetical protein